MTSFAPGVSLARPRVAVLSSWVRDAPVTVIIAGLVVLFFAVAFVAPSLLATGSPVNIDLTHALQAPSLHHIFGTDESGRDVYTRVIYGARESLLIGLGATGLAMSLAVILGTTAGLVGGLVDGIISRVGEIMFAFPVLMLALLFVAVFGPSVLTELIAVGISSAPGYARMIRGQVLAVRGSGYVEAAHALGHPSGRVIRRHILPNAMRPMVVVTTLGIGQSIVWASGLAFLGLGAAPPSPEWGALLDAGREYITQAWWLEMMPGLAIVLLALSLTTIGRYIQQRLEGRGRR
jgi:peptide/nickel transport system permease protein